MQVKDYALTDVTETFDPENMEMYVLKDGTTYYAWKTSFDNRSSRKWHPRSYAMYVDINSAQKGPNSIGRDIFTFNVNGNGELLAYGSRAWKDMTSGATWEVHCNKETVSKWQNHNDLGDHCAGSVVDNNYKIIYKY